MTPERMAELKSRAEQIRAGRQMRFSTDGSTVYFRLYVDDTPTTVPQSLCDVLMGPTFAQAIVDALTAIPDLLTALDEARGWLRETLEIAAARECIGVGCYDRNCRCDRLAEIEESLRALAGGGK